MHVYVYSSVKPGNLFLDLGDFIIGKDLRYFNVFHTVVQSCTLWYRNIPMEIDNLYYTGWSF